jgi:hypothetical protein
MLPKSYKLFSKSALPGLLRTRDPSLQADRFVAAAHVFPMRVNNHVVDDLIDWHVDLYYGPHQTWPESQCFSNN